MVLVPLLAGLVSGLVVHRRAVAVATTAAAWLAVVALFVHWAATDGSNEPLGVGFFVSMAVVLALSVAMVGLGRRLARGAGRRARPSAIR